MPRLPALGGLLLAAALAAPLAAADAPWPQFRGPNRDDISPDKGLLAEWPKDGPPLAWKAAGVGAGFSSVSIAGGRVFTMGDKGDSSFVFAVAQDSGKPLWSAKVGRAGGNYAGTRCTPTVDGDRVYALGQFGDLVCLKAATGQVVWRKNLPRDFQGHSGGWNYTESPLIDGDKLVCTPGGKEATMVALHKKTGAVVWKGVIPGGDSAGYASAVISEGAGVRQYVQLLGGGVAGFRADDGHLLWRYTRYAGNTANIPTPVVRGDYVFTAAGYGAGGALLKLGRDGGGVKEEVVYHSGSLTNKHGGVVLVGEYLYGDTDDSGHPFCAEFLTGKVRWKKEERTRGAGSAAVTFADGHLYFRYDNGWVALVEASPDGYREVSTFKIPNSSNASWPHPVVAGGRLYLREQDVLWCYDVKQR
jgi:outer membrane protein assembly factor BamB